MSNNARAYGEKYLLRPADGALKEDTAFFHVEGFLARHEIKAL
jgi:hypothetical protein